MFERPCWAMNSILLIRITCLLRSYINVVFSMPTNLVSSIIVLYSPCMCVWCRQTLFGCKQLQQNTAISHKYWLAHCVLCTKKWNPHRTTTTARERMKMKKKNRPTANNGQMQCRKRPNDEHTRCIGVSNCFTCFLFSFGFLPRWLLLVCKQTGFRMDGWIG